jgi:hypothetical protein
LTFDPGFSTLEFRLLTLDQEGHMSTIRVVHYLNQFFVGLGAEAHAGTGPGKKAGR